MSLREILAEIQEELVDKDVIRQEVQTASRKATRLSKQTIFLAHKGKIEEAEKTIKEAKDILVGLGELSERYPDTFYSGSVDAAFQEYSEANIFFQLVKDGDFVSYKDISVSSTQYILGLADVIGELRRRALDMIRKGQSTQAEKSLEMMEEIYSELINNDELNILVQGLRRKCDIARRVIEATRGDVTIELRRTSLEDSISELKALLKPKISILKRKQHK